ncbi:hypothetical protein B0A58_09975 [Flavobacterium branchiophilum NBRC 15030 = ATCC 35035]|nr:hypothetical protein B0A58_09975 [Flavobacterium branchiophilum NBRC 15030 = ATCC 35035]
MFFKEKNKKGFPLLSLTQNTWVINQHLNYKINITIVVLQSTTMTYTLEKPIGFAFFIGIIH